ncbi:hypothetical protein DO71_5620 [Burkholderia pseudomallei]|nr:hypothetical protein DO71_5620 [Burkholderia pseudomallei]
MIRLSTRQPVPNPAGAGLAIQPPVDFQGVTVQGVEKGEVKCTFRCNKRLHHRRWCAKRSNPISVRSWTR